MRSEDEQIRWMIGIGIILFMVFSAVAVVSISQEAKTFNKFKKPDQPEATFWDAAFSELRVGTDD